MARIAWALAAALAACGGGEPSKPMGARDVCRRSFLDVLDAWEGQIGDVPRACRNLDARYLITVADREADIPCAAAEMDTRLVGCHLASAEAIYILRRDDLGMIDTAIHEWTHALSLCVTGDQDAGHVAPGLWLVAPGIESVEGSAIVNVTAGSCQ